MFRTQARRADQVARPLVNDAGRRRQLDGLDVAEGAVVAQHLHVQQPHQELLGLLLVGGQLVLLLRPGTSGRPGLLRPLKLLLEDGHLPGDDPILLLLGLGFPDRLEELEELLGQVHSAHGLGWCVWVLYIPQKAGEDCSLPSTDCINILEMLVGGATRAHTAISADGTDAPIQSKINDERNRKRGTVGKPLKSSTYLQLIHSSTW